MTKRSEQLEELKNESAIKKILTSEVKYIIAIIIFLVGVVAPYYDIRQEIALIKQNHLAHIENISNSIKEMQSEIKDMKSTEILLMTKIAEQNSKIIDK